MFQIMVDGIAWIDSDGNDQWTRRDASALADLIENQGYTDVHVVS
jgi:hypothetical protein